MAFKSNMLFDVLGNILVVKSFDLYKTHIESEHFKDAAKFMILRYLTMSPNSQVRDIVIDNYDVLEKMQDIALYKFLILHIPKQKSSFIKYIH